MKLKPQTRFLNVAEREVSAESRTMTFPFSSEAPVDRYFGTEILVHEDKAADLSRLNNGAPLLFNHNIDDVVGVVEKAWIDKKSRRAYGTVRFANTARAEEVFGMVKDAILPNVSFAYRISDMEQDKSAGDEVYRVTGWHALEISIVTIPADQSVGIGRAFGDDEIEVAVRNASGGSAEVFTAAAAAQPPKGNATMQENTAAAGANAEVIDNAAPERLRIKAVQAMGRTHKIDDKTVEAWIDQGVTPEAAAQKVLDVLAERGRTGVSKSAAELGLKPAEAKKYSLARMIAGMASKNYKDIGYEMELSKQVQNQLGRSNISENTFFVPTDILKRDLVVATNTIGGYLVQTQNQGFIDLVRNRSVLLAMGARRLSGLQGNVAIPKLVTGGTATWLATEATAAGEVTQVFGQVTLSPKNVAGYSEISRQLLLQSSPDAEGIVMDDLAKGVATAADLAGLVGPGTAGQPTGITLAGGIGAVTIATGGIDYDDILEFQSDVAASNLLSPSCGYVSRAAVAKTLMTKQRFSSTDTPLWEGNMLDGRMAGFRAMSSEQMSASTLLFGDFSQVIWGEWGVLEVEVNPYANFPAGIIGVRSFYTMDIAVRHGAAFSLSTGTIS